MNLKKRKPRTISKRVNGWGGFYCDKLDSLKAKQYGFNDEPYLRAVFLSKADALLRYEDVRRVTITYALPKVAKNKRRDY